MTVSAILSAAANELSFDLIGNEREFITKMNEIMNSKMTEIASANPLDATAAEVNFEIEAE